MRILVTGASGNAGRELVAALERRAVPHVAARRSSGFDFRVPATWDAALEGCDRLFLLRPPAISDVKSTLLPFLDRARTRGVTHVVFLSVAGAEKNALVPHHAVEAHLRRTRGHTLLRPGFFAQNLQDAYLRDLREDDRIYVPAGRGRVAFVDLRDVAEVAADALVDPRRHEGRAYTLTGPEALDFVEVAALLTSATGRDVRYEPASIAGYLRHLVRRRRLSVAQATVQTILHVGLRFGQAARVDPTLPHLLGRQARTLRDYVADHVETWR